MNIQWDSQAYKDRFSFVPQYGADVLTLITAKPGAIAVDLGCGNGTLTKKLQDKGFAVTGLDASKEMIDLAIRTYPELSFAVADALTFTLDQKADVIFSNAVFHWIDEERQDDLAANLAAQLKPGGELVCEFGGYGCGEAIHSMLEQQFRRRGFSYPRTFYFPTVGQYAPLLERHGLRVEYAVLFDRPTPQSSQNGIADWIEMFVKTPFEGMKDSIKREIVKDAQTGLRETLYRDGIWYVDYVRIRVRARKR